MSRPHMSKRITTPETISRSDQFDREMVVKYGDLARGGNDHTQASPHPGDMMRSALGLTNSHEFRIAEKKGGATGGTTFIPSTERAVPRCSAAQLGHITCTLAAPLNVYKACNAYDKV